MTRGTEVGTILLAAGASTRFGAGIPKALAPVGPGTAIERIARLAGERGLHPVVLVWGARSELLEGTLPNSVDRVVENPGWASGRTGSIQRGIRELPASQGVLVWPVDVPFVAGTTVDRLLSTAREDSLAVWWTPTYRERGGHPILLSAWAARQVLDLPSDLPLRSAGFRQGIGERRVPVNDPGIVDNLNTREAFARAEAAWRHRGEP